MSAYRLPAPLKGANGSHTERSSVGPRVTPPGFWRTPSTTDMYGKSIEDKIETVRQQDNVQCQQCSRSRLQGARLVVQVTTPFDPVEARNSVELSVFCDRCATDSAGWGVGR